MSQPKIYANTTKGDCYHCKSEYFVIIDIERNREIINSNNSQ